MRFYCPRGNNVAISEDGGTASRRSVRDFTNGVVFGDRPLRTGSIVTVKVAKIDEDWSGGLKLGVVATSPVLLGTPGSCLAIEGDSWILLGDSVLHNGLCKIRDYGPNLDDLKKGDTISLLRTENNQLEVFLNNQSLGHAAADLPEKVFLVVELYGRCTSVELSEEEEEGSEEVAAENGATGLSLMAVPARDISAQNPRRNHSGRIRFHRCRGCNVVLSSGRMVAARRGADRDYANGVVLTDRPLRTDEIFVVQIARQVTRWTGNIEIGVCSQSPETLVGQLPSTMTKLTASTVVMLSSSSILVDGKNGVVDYSSMDLDDLKEGDTVGVEIKNTGHLHFWVGGVDQGPAVQLDLVNQQFWAVVDLFGKTSEVRILPNPRIHEAVTPSGRFPRRISHHRLRRSEELLREELAELCRRDPHLETPDYHYGTEEEEEEEDALCRGNAFNTLVHGPNVVVTSTGRTAFRPWPEHHFNQALVVSQAPLKIGELFCIQVEQVEHKWIGCMEIGLIAADPRSFSPPWPHSLSEVNGDVWMLSGSVLSHNGTSVNSSYRLDLDAVDKDSKVCLVMEEIGSIKFYLDGRDQGVAFTGLPPNVWVAIDLYGKCSKVSVVNPEASGLFDTVVMIQHRARMSLLGQNPSEEEEFVLEPAVPLTNHYNDDDDDDASNFSSEETEMRRMMELVDALPRTTRNEQLRFVSVYELAQRQDAEGEEEEEEEDEDEDDGGACWWPSTRRTPLQDMSTYNLFDDLAVGRNVGLSDGGRRATRSSRSFNHALVFSRRPLMEGFPFCFRVEKVDSRWPGTLRVGVLRRSLESMVMRGTLAQPPDMASMTKNVRWADGHALWNGSKVLLAPFGEALLHPTVGMVIKVVSNSNGVYLIANGRSIGAVTLEASTLDQVVVIDLFGPVVEIAMVGGTGLRKTRGCVEEEKKEQAESLAVDQEDLVKVASEGNGDFGLQPVAHAYEDNLTIVDNGKRAFRSTGEGPAWLVCSQPVPANMPIKIQVEAVNPGHRSSFMLGAVRCGPQGRIGDFQSITVALSRCPVGALLMTDSAITVFNDQMMQPTCENYDFPPMPVSMEQLKLGDSLVVLFDEDGLLYLFVNNRAIGRSLLPVPPSGMGLSTWDQLGTHPCGRFEDHTLDRILLSHASLEAGKAAAENEKRGVPASADGVQFVLLLNLEGRCTQISLGDVDG